ncbi:hypothetical protein LTR82_006937 [Friedmanniomyces endolithicus]|uniref:Uncharacterized protein n=1 Tax=Friedmanniomyces endolithicus TaxID=329885 RepID=A0AAN6FQQ2_9PEZI|nr:hypothetical protein LTR82_006937 [Friedmanniomyces endolithicus]
MLLILAALWAMLATLALSAPLSSSPLPPSQDPWYTAPLGFETAPPGAVLRLRCAPGNITTIFTSNSAAYSVLYRTTDSRYQPSWAVTTLLIPKQTNGSALLSYQIPYSSVDIDAVPSFALYNPAFTGTPPIYSDIQSALSLGWYVNIPDFETHTASFGVGITEGHATLDSVRAVLNAGFDLAADARYALWGYSGGSIASEWAAELQAQSAPELSFAGAAIGGTVPNVTTILTGAPGQWWAGLLPEALLGFTIEYPAARDYLLSQLKLTGPYNRTGFLVAENFGVEQAFAVLSSSTSSTATKAFLPRSCKTSKNNGYMGYHGIPQMPLYFYKATHDEIASIEAVDELVSRYCDVGGNVLYERDSIGGHLAEEINGDASAFRFLQSVLGGTYNHTGCTVRDVALNITDSPL